MHLAVLKCKTINCKCDIHGGDRISLVFSSLNSLVAYGQMQQKPTPVTESFVCELKGNVKSKISRKKLW